MVFRDFAEVYDAPRCRLHCSRIGLIRATCAEELQKTLDQFDAARRCISQLALGRLAWERGAFDVIDCSMSERVGREDRVVKDHRLGFAAEEADFQLGPELARLCARLAIMEFVEPA